MLHIFFFFFSFFAPFLVVDIKSSKLFKPNPIGSMLL